MQTRYERCNRKSQKSKIRKKWKTNPLPTWMFGRIYQNFGNDSKRSFIIIPHSDLVRKFWWSNWKVGKSYIGKSYLSWNVPCEVGQLFQLRLVLSNSKKVSNLRPYNNKLSNLSIFYLLFPTAPYDNVMWHHCQYDYHTLMNQGCENSLFPRQSRNSLFQKFQKRFKNRRHGNCLALNLYFVIFERRYIFIIMAKFYF